VVAALRREVEGVTELRRISAGWGRPWATWCGEKGGGETVSMRADERRRKWCSTVWTGRERGSVRPVYRLGGKDKQEQGPGNEFGRRKGEIDDGSASPWAVGELAGCGGVARAGEDNREEEKAAELSYTARGVGGRRSEAARRPGGEKQRRTARTRGEGRRTLFSAEEGGRR
jgi:hypothetical protein